MPLVMPIVVYVLTRVKFMILEEGGIDLWQTIEGVKQKLEEVSGASLSPRQSEPQTIGKEKKEEAQYDKNESEQSSFFGDINEESAESAS